MSRFSKTDWLDLGLKVLTRNGPGSIRIDTLCAEAMRTKGSFYHHFKDRDAFITELMTHWEKQLTANVIKKTERASNPDARLAVLNRLAGRIDMELERALRRWAGSDLLVAEAVARVDKRRIDYLARLWQEAKNISSQQAIDLAVMNHATWVGFQQLYVSVGDERRTRIDQIYARLSESLTNRNSVLDGA
jgi:AcrR family transcriptional regulator